MNTLDTLEERLPKSLESLSEADFWLPVQRCPSRALIEPMGRRQLFRKESRHRWLGRALCPDAFGNSPSHPCERERNTANRARAARCRRYTVEEFADGTGLGI